MKNKIPGAKKNGCHWEIPYDALVNFKEDRKKPKYIRPKGMINVTEAARIIGVCAAAVYRYCNDGRIPGAQKTHRHWEIPIGALRVFKKRREAAYRGQTFPRGKF
jgi:hypothetical protein